MPFHHCLLGKESGNFRILQVPREEFLRTLSRERERLNLKKIFAPRCDFTNRLKYAGEDDLPWCEWFSRTAGYADGGIVTFPRHAVAIFNADCPVVILYDELAGRLAVIHAGFRCLVPEDRRSPGILRVALDEHSFGRLGVKAVVGYGIGRCCYGASHLPELDEEQFQPFVKKAVSGPRAGEPSLDLLGFIKHQLVEGGLSEAQITTEGECTACSEKYHSHTREGKEAGRNAVLAWFD